MLVTTRLTINAKPETVWKILMDFNNYSSWNPFIKSIQGEVDLGNQLIVSLDDMVFKPKVVENNTNSSFMWLGHLFFKGIFDGQHSFKLIEQENKTLFIHEETFSGFLPKLLRKGFFEKLENKFSQMNFALKTRAEELNSSAL